MSLSPTDHVYIRFWQEHTCVGCGAVFGYKDQFHVQPQFIPDGATADGVAGHMLEGSVRGPKPIPCPRCGWVQPDMVGFSGCAHVVATLLIGFLAAVVLAVAGLGGMSRAVAPYVVAGLLAAGLVWNAVVVLGQRPNADLKGNRAKARRRVDAGWARLVEEGGGKEPGADRAPPPGMLAVCGVMAVTPALAAGPVIWPGGFWVLLPAAVVVFGWAGLRLETLSTRPRRPPIPGRLVDVRVDVTDGREPDGYDYLPAGVGG